MDRGLDPLGITDGTARPMVDVFDTKLAPDMFTYEAEVPPMLRSTTLPVPPAMAVRGGGDLRGALTGLGGRLLRPRHDARYWTRVMAGQNFDVEDALDTDRFNRALWRGLTSRPYPEARRPRGTTPDGD